MNAQTTIPSELVAFLTTISNDFDDHTAKLVAADWCQENGYTSLEWLLRRMAQDYVPFQTHVPFLFTGSRRYGTPGPDSDFDWVLYGNMSLVLALGTEADTATHKDADTFGSCGIDSGMRFGPVNLICVTVESQWQAWLSGTEDLVAEAPVTRGRAVEVFQEKFAMAGLNNPDDGFSGQSEDDDPPDYVPYYPYE